MYIHESSTNEGLEHRKIFVARMRFNTFNTLIERFNISFYIVGYQ